MDGNSFEMAALRTLEVFEGQGITAGRGSPRAALRYATHAYAALDRRMDEADALTKWVARSARALGLAEEQAPDDEQLAKPAPLGVTADAWREVGRSLVAAGRRAADDDITDTERWIAAAARALAFDPLDTDILALAVDYALDRRTERLFDALSTARQGRNCLHVDAHLFALLLAAPVREVQARLASTARLQASGLLTVDGDGDMRVLPRLMALIGRATPLGPDLASQLLGSTTPEPLAWESFAHLGREADMAAGLLRAALDGREAGVNVLLYGPPGTGKTSFAAALAARIGAPLRPVVECDDAGNEPERHERLAGLRLAQHLLPPGSAVLLFDEAEDLFGERRSANGGDTGRGSRVFMHRLLERTPVPVVWTANNIAALGPAVLRRMTLCIELALPDLAARTRLWREMGEAERVVLAEADAARLARLVPAAPAVARTALRGARLAGGGAETARLIVEGVARAVGGGTLPPPEPDEAALYDPALVNADCDLDALAAQLARPGAPRAVSLLLSGPAGTGKSAWVRHLAGCMGLPVMQRRASDLLDCYVGGTERNIARTFAEARTSGAFLVFDEADSLLLERADAVRSWEISQVNEMLTWMEQHSLPFACTTNLAERLGPGQPAAVFGQGALRLAHAGAGPARLPALLRLRTTGGAQRPARLGTRRLRPSQAPGRAGGRGGGRGGTHAPARGRVRGAARCAHPDRVPLTWLARPLGQGSIGACATNPRNACSASP